MNTGGEVNKEVVGHLVEHVINQWHLEELDALFEPTAATKARADFESFHEAFPDWHMDLREVVAEGDTVVARFKCEGTNTGPWQGAPATDRRMSVDEVFFFRFRNGRIRSMWGLEDTWTRMTQLGLNQ